MKSLFQEAVEAAMSEARADFGVNVKGDLTADDIQQGLPLYHRPKDSYSDKDKLSIIKSLMTKGFDREYTGSNGGNLYGPGVYNVYALSSSLDAATGYGRYIVKSFLLGGFKNFLIFDEDYAKQVYGDNYSIGDQARLLFPPKIAETIAARWGDAPMHTLSQGSNATRTSETALSIVEFLGNRIEDSKVRGIVYAGGHDGFCAFVRNFSDVVPFYYSEDNGATWNKGITDELIWRAGHNTDTKATLINARDENGRKIADDVADKSINGYAIMYKGDKANYFEVAKNDLISDVWFDFAGNFDKNNFASVIYNGRELFLEKQPDGTFYVIDENFGPICTLDELPSFDFDSLESF